MNEINVIVKVLVDQTDGRLNRSKLCGTLRAVGRESLDESNKSIEVFNNFKNLLVYLIYQHIILAGSWINVFFLIKNGPNGRIESFLCEIMPADTVVIRANKNSKRIGTDSIYENVEKKRPELVVEEDEPIGEVLSNKSQEILQDDDDATSSEEEKSKSLSIDGLFKYLRNENGVNIYECNVSANCRQEIRAHKDTESQRRKHLGSKSHDMPEYLYFSQKINTKKTEISSSRKKEIDESLICCTIEDARPFGDFRKPGMLKLLNLIVPGYTPPTRETITKRLSKRYKEFRQQLTHFLKQIQHLALTTDMWKNRHLTHFLGLTIHFFDDEFNYVSLVIGFRKFTGRHLAVRLSRFIRNELNKLNILDQIIATTADNASDIVKALSNSDLGERFSCFCHNLNLTLKDIVKPSKQTQSQVQYSSDDQNSSLSESESQVNDADYDLNRSFTEPEELSEHEILDNEQTGKEVAGEVQNLLARIRTLVRMIRKCGNVCSYAKDKIKKNENLSNVKNFILDFHVRWNSTFIMLKRLVLLKDIVINITERPSGIDGITQQQITKLRRLDLSEEDWSTVETLIKIFQPFFEATKMLSARKYATLSCSFVVKKVLIKSLQESTQDRKEKVIKEFILKQLLYHLEDKASITQAQELITLKATYLDPTTFKYLSPNQIKTIESDLIKEFKNAETPEPQNTQQNEFAPNTVLDKKSLNSIDSFSKKYGLIAANLNLTLPADKFIQSELNRYKKELISNEMGFSCFWKKHSFSLPMLSSAVRKYCIIPASSVAVESAFSEANFIQRKERSSLSSKNLRYSIVLKSAMRSKIFKNFFSKVST